MIKIDDLRQKSFLGIILENIDPINRGRYKVYIPELMPSISENKGIWCSNHVHKWRYTDSDLGEYGEYHPLQKGTTVMIEFFENDYNSGYIDRVVSDMNGNALPLKLQANERDQAHVIAQTPNKQNIIYIRENTNEDSNTMYVVYNRDDEGRRSVVKFSEDGIHIYTRDNTRVKVEGDADTEIDGNCNITVQKALKIVCHEQISIHSTSDTKVYSEANVYSYSAGDTFIDTGGSLNLNCGGSHSPFEETPVDDLKTAPGD